MQKLQHDSPELIIIAGGDYGIVKNQMRLARQVAQVAKDMRDAVIPSEAKNLSYGSDSRAKDSSLHSE